MKKSTLWISMIAALALGSAGAVGTGAGTVITNIAQVTYPDPDGGPTVTANSNTLTATVTPVPSLSIV